MKKNNTGLKKIIAVLGVAIIFVVFVAVETYVSKFNLMQKGNENTEHIGTIDENDEAVKADNDAINSALKDVDEAESIEAEGDIVSSEDVLNVLLIGTDERTEEFSDNARGDSCMLLSLNKKTMEVKLISFERGMGMPILSGPYKGQYDWLTHTFRYGGADLMMQEIRECFKVDVNHYIRVNFATFEKAIDAIGGIDVELTKSERDGLNGLVYTNATTRQEVHEGINHLDGYDALQYARIRFIDNDWKRIERQRNVINQAIKQTQKLSLKQLNDVLNTVLPLIETNFTIGEITSLLPLALKYDQITVDQMTIPAQGTFGNMKGMNNRSMFAVDFEANSRILEEFIYNKK